MFYLTPPQSYAKLSTLEKDIETRIQFLIKVNQYKGEPSKIKENLKCIPSLCSNLDCLIEGSKRDLASHFIIRIACLQRGQIQSYWIKAEMELLLYRLKCGGKESIFSTLAKFLRDIKKVLATQFLSEHYETFLKQILFILEPLIKDEFIFCSNEVDCHHHIIVPWVLANEFVSKREVELKKGFARIPCFLLLRFLSHIFQEILIMSIDHLQNQNLDFDDIRVQKLIKKINSIFMRLIIISKVYDLSESTSISKHADVEKEVHNFPLCMQQLHLQLKKTSRLNHYERFRYTLFLKDIGLPVEENILLWKHYYSMAPKCSQFGCQHSWIQNTAKKYEYSIRHMYGIEGKRISYSSHSCSSLQAQSPQPQESGGCPFKHLEEQYLTRLFASIKFLCPTQRESILAAAKNGNPSLACGIHLSSTNHKHFSKPPNLSRFSSCYSTLGRDQECTRRLTFKRTKSLGSKSAFNSSVDDVSDALISTDWNSQKKQTCFQCNFNGCRPEMSFLSPKDYFKLVKLKK